MSRTKILLSTLMAVIFLAVQVIAVGAAPASQEINFITGTIVTDGITLDTETNTVVVTLVTDEGTQSVRISLDEAIELKLVKDDGAGNYVADDTRYNTEVQIDPAAVIPDDTDGTVEEPQHPVGSAIADFFFGLLGVDYETVMAYHDNGAGFGVITQALWMTKALGGDSSMFGAIMDAKQSKDYSAFASSDGTVPKNWGQLRKTVFKEQGKDKQNLGAIMSGHAEGDPDDSQVASQNNGNGQDKEKGKGKDKGKNNNKNKNK